jgi:hypothetical protein
MLILPLKPAVRADVQNTLATWLDSEDQQVSFATPSSSSAADPLPFVLPKPAFTSAQCKDDLIRLQSLRNCLSDSLLKADSHKAALEENALQDLYEYHAAVLEFEKRGFPTADDAHNGLVLGWKGAWSPHKTENHATLLWDRACVTYNIVALILSQAAVDGVMTDRQACKTAVGLYQNAAGILAVLLDFVSADDNDFATVDLSSPMLHFWKAYCLAEGQTFVYRMASLAAAADVKHTTLAYLAQAAFTLWNDALSKAQDPRLTSEVAQDAQAWATYCKSNAMLCSAKAHYHMAVSHRLQHEWGKELARLKECITKLNACTEFLHTVSTSSDQASVAVIAYIQRECKAICPVVKDRWTEGEKDNYNIYQDDIPSNNPDIPAKQLIKDTGGYTAQMLTPSKPLFVGL